MRKVLFLAGMVFASPASAQFFSSNAPGIFSIGTQQVIAYIKAADMNVTTDQPLTMLPTLPAAYVLSTVFATNCSASPVLSVGGLYTAASKGGIAIVSAAQTFTALTTGPAVQALTIQSASLTTAGKVRRSAIGKRMRSSICSGVRPSICAASTVPGAILRNPPRRFSA